MANPNHVCVTGEVTTEERNDGTYLVIKCSICGKNIVESQLTVDCNGNHDLHTVQTIQPGCTKPGYEIKWCTRCNDYQEITEIPALDHDEVAGEAKAATCTEAGHTAGKYCKRCSTKENTVWTEPQVTISALGHDYDRKTGKCKHCGADQPTVKIDDNILHSMAVTEEKFGNYTTITFNGYEDVIDRVVFGYKEDYVHSINASKVEFSEGVTYSGVEVYVVYKKNPNYGKSYDELTAAEIDQFEQKSGNVKPEAQKDNRKYLVDYYVLSDSRMCYDNNPKSNGYGLCAYLGYGVKYVCKVQDNYIKAQVHYSGAVKEIRFENFDVSDATNLAQMFCLCNIEKLDLSGFSCSWQTVQNTNMFSFSQFLNVIYPSDWPEDWPKASIRTTES